MDSHKLNLKCSDEKKIVIICKKYNEISMFKKKKNTQNIINKLRSSLKQLCSYIERMS